MQASEFKQLFLPLSRQIYWMAWRLTGNAEEAEDLTQEVYAQLWTKRESLSGISNPIAYCSVLVRNLYLNQVRKQRVETTEMARELFVADGNRLEDAIEQRQACEQVMRLIGQLPEQQRKVVTMHDVEGCSNEEIRQQTGLASTHLRVLLSRARKTIRQLFKN
jgi:RNA polymerase sigma-70 factor (ECF subfamily)